MRVQKAWTYSLRVSLFILAPFDLLASLGMDVYLPVVPRMPAALNTTQATVQLTLSLYMLVLGSGQLAFGPLSDRLGRRPVLLGGAALFTTTSALMAVTSSAPVFISLRIVQAFGAAAALVATFATVRDVYAERPESALIYGLLGSMLGFVPAVGPVVGASIAHLFGWRGVFAFLGGLGVLASAHDFFCWPETRPMAQATSQRGHFHEILTNKPFLIYTFGFSTAIGAFFVFFSTAPHVLIGKAGLSPFAFSIAFATVPAVMVATSRSARHLAGRWGERGCLVRGMALLLIGSMLLLAGQVLVYPSVWGFVGPMWMIAVGISITCAITANGALRSFSHAAGTATALYSCGESLVVSVAGTLAVVWFKADTAWPLIGFCAIFALITIGLARALPRS